MRGEPHCVRLADCAHCRVRRSCAFPLPLHRHPPFSSLAAGVTALTPGFPYVGTQPAWAYSYYSLAATDGSAQISISITPFSGDPDLLVGNSALGQFRPVINNASSYCAFSVTPQRDVVDIFPGQPCYCTPPCTYYIGVLAWGGPASYSIVGTETANPVVTLLDGIPQFGYLEQGSTQQFTFFVQPDPTIPISRRVIEVAVGPLFGDPDIYVTLDGRVPSTTVWNYRSSASTGVDYIAIRGTDPQYRASPCYAAQLSNGTCQVRVAVVGFTTTIYLVVAETGRYVQLLDGVPSTVSVRQLLKCTIAPPPHAPLTHSATPAYPQGEFADAGLFTYFRFSIGQPNQRVTITVTPLSGKCLRRLRA